MMTLNKLITPMVIVGFLVLALSGLAMAQNSENVQKANYVVTQGDKASLITVWLSDETLAVSPQGSKKIAMWRLWQTDNPTFYQAYPEVDYRIEFDRITGHEMQVLLNDLKQLVTEKSLVDSAQIKGKNFVLSSIETGKAVEQQITGWQDFKTFDYADIGDNEADPVLGQLIQQGFVRGF